MAAASRLAALLLAALSLATARMAAADEYSDFRIPAGSVLQWTGNAGGSASWGSSQVPYGRTDNGHESFVLGSDVYQQSESDSRMQTWIGTLTTSGGRSHVASNLTSPGYGEEARTDFHHDAQVYARAALTQEWYPRALPLAFTAGVRVSDAHGRAWLGEHRRQTFLSPASWNEQLRSSDYWDSGQTGSMQVGAGVGRVRNATGLFVARVIERRLRASGVLTRDLGTQARRELVALVYSRDKLSRPHSRPASPLWRQLTDILVRDGALADPGMNPASLFAAVEPFIGASGNLASDGLPYSPVLRRVGWSVRGVFSGNASHDVHRGRFVLSQPSSGSGTTPRFESSFRYTSESTADEGGVVAEFHRPLAEHWQWDASLEAFMPLRNDGSAIHETAVVNATWLVTDRWLASASATHRRDMQRDKTGKTLADTSELDARGSVQYWLSDHLAADASVSQRWTHQAGLFSGGPGTARVASGQASIGLEYRFAGHARVPGVTGMD